MDSNIDAMAPFGFTHKVVVAKMNGPKISSSRNMGGNTGFPFTTAAAYSGCSTTVAQATTTTTTTIACFTAATAYYGCSSTVAKATTTTTTIASGCYSTAARANNTTCHGCNPSTA